MLDFLLSSLLVWKYALLFGVVSFAAFGFPIPATALVVAAGAFAAQGYFDVFPVFASAMAAAIVWDHAAYFVSRRYGKYAFAKIGFAKALSSDRYLALESKFQRHSSFAIIGSRFVGTSLVPAVNILSGLSKIPVKRFFTLVVAGEFFYVSLFGGLGYLFGDQWQAIFAIVRDVGWIVAVSIGAVVTLAVLRYRKRGWRFRRG